MTEDRTDDAPAEDAAADAATEEQPTAPPISEPTLATRRRFDGRAVVFGGSAGALVVLVFAAGFGVGSQTSSDGPRGVNGHTLQRRSEGARPLPGDEMRGGGFSGEQQGERGGFEMRGGPGMGDGPGAMLRHRGGGLGVVDDIGDDTITLATIGGGGEDEVTFRLDDDVEVKRRGGDGADDVEDADIGDIDEGDIVIIRAARSDDDAKEDEHATASAIVLLRDADD